ncbi:hypothetical protein [Pseudoalteromonas sp. R3]|nr:hypothetical protein [Pseudoalteromonas sp. R3]
MKFTVNKKSLKSLNDQNQLDPAATVHVAGANALPKDSIVRPTGWPMELN